MKRFRSIKRQLKRGNLKIVRSTVTNQTMLLRRTNSGSWVQYF